MSFPQASSDQNEATDEVPLEEVQSPAPEEPETEVDTVECPNCGHEFTGNYCPECGQEADPSATVVEVIGGFFRELVDLEHGFWPTFVGLTVRPGAVPLGSSNRWCRSRPVSHLDRGQPPPRADSEASPSSNGPEAEAEIWKVVQVVGEQISALSGGSYGPIALALLITGLLAVLLYRLFGDEMKRMGEALGVSSFLAAHATFLR